MRVGNITSSGIAAIMSSDKSGKAPGKPFFTYIDECNMERRLGRRLEVENNSKSCAWGKLCELYVQSKNEFIGTEWEQRPDEPIVNPSFPFHVGTPDMRTEDTNGEIKSPFMLKSFCQMVAPIYNGMDGFEAAQWIKGNYVIGSKKAGEEYYWQQVSNSILCGTKFAEWKIFCPYERELDELRALAQQHHGGAAGNFYGIANSLNEDLPYLVEGGYYKNWNTIRFEVPQEDKDALIKRLELAGQYLETVEVKQEA